MPGPAQGQMIQKCFESMKVEGMKKFREGLGQMPHEARACLEGKLGKEKVTAIENGQEVEVGLEIGAVMQECGSILQSSMLKMMEDQLSKAPPEIRNCIKGKINDEMMAKLKSGQAGPEIISSLVTGCMANFKPPMPAGFKPENMPEGFKPGDMPFGIPSGGFPTGNYGQSGIPIQPSGYPILPTGSGVMPNIDCGNFAMVPACSYVPESVRDLCKKCKGE